LVFIDGIGIGKKDEINNPFFGFGFKTFLDIFGEIPHLEKRKLKGDNSFLFPVDALMGIPGIPLSGTGQTSIFCGVNAPKLIGQHFGPYPYSTLIPVIKEKNIFHEFRKRSMKASFANAYPKMFFEYVKSGRRRLSVTTMSCILSGMKLNSISDLYRGNALSPDIINKRLVERFSYKLPIIKPETAAKRLIGISALNHFTAFEIFQTDHLGHGRNADQLEEFIGILDRFLYYLLTHLPKNQTLVVCSDHGNFENLSIKMHTFNPSLCITAGRNAEQLSKKIKKLYNIKPAIMEMYD
jgi:hypothetical protein